MSEISTSLINHDYMIRIENKFRSIPHIFSFEILYNYSLLLRSMRVFMDLKNDIH
jgi:hypothetical protein